MASLFLYRHHRHNFLPGPRELPIIGNLHRIPATNPWRTFKNWHEIYEPIISVKLGTRRMVVLVSHEVTQDLLVKRAAIYSSRPKVLAYQEINLVAEAFPILDRLPKFPAPWKRVPRALHQKQVSFFGYITEIALKQERGYIIGLIQTGNETTAIALEAFVMACVLHRVAVHQTHRELDQVVGRLLAPGGLHHATVKDNEYRGFKIPKDTIMVANHCSLDMDKAIFNRAKEFNPDRRIQNPHRFLAVFEFSQRVYPGQHIGRNSLFTVISQLLWAFNFDYAYHDGKKLEIDPLDMTQGLSSGPSLFKALIQVRGPGIQRVIH
ncbi:cytochrome P450 [Penicillium cf. griseofulvum]|uniref:Cytochrome P450 n=1 Tax=Penicillium cf. griseofulvum TaxID=2972120 RepID=A0A9W9M0Z0_9EURO|nr:cytochrome P450 [Penicillium cf. griseofulvum]KAJ5436647.1 cytochrome P450 [Penicillium cf. griseofulvum]